MHSTFYRLFNSNFIDPESDDDDEQESATDGATFVVERNTWVPSQGCCSVPLPAVLPDEAITHTRIRHQCSDVRHVEVNGQLLPEIIPGGFMVGPDCIPRHDSPICCNCNRPWSQASVVDDGPFILRTKFGPVLRRKTKHICPCLSECRWDPSTEFIHTIRDDAEGGEVLLLCF
jgi:hypothetical protein